MKRKKEKFTYQILLGTKIVHFNTCKKNCRQKKKQHNKAKLMKQLMFNATFKNNSAFISPVLVSNLVGLFKSR